MRNPSWNLTQFGLSLVTVADAQGLSYYSDKTAARLLSLNEAQLREARRSLLAAGLIAYESPLYQVLSLEPTLAGEQQVARTRPDAAPRWSDLPDGVTSRRERYWIVS